MAATAPIRVLLIEDNLEDVMLVREILKDAGSRHCQLESATRLEDGLDHLRAAPFDVVLLDLTLPDTYGIDTYDQLHANFDIPVVVFSGNTNDEIALLALEHGAQDYLVKGTVSGDLLLRTLRYAITRHRLTSELQQSEERLRVMAEQLPALLWTTDEKLQFTSLRGRGLAALHVAQGQLVGRAVTDYFGADNPGFRSGELHAQALQGEPQSASMSFDGHWYHAHIEPLKNALGDVIGTIGVALDVTGERKLQRDVEAAHRIQEHLLPQRQPQVRGFDIAGACFPAERCSGDFFDYIPMRGGRLAVVLADVSGHGFGPAIMAATIRSYLRTAAVLGNQVHEMLALGNRLLIGDGDANLFASAVVASLDSRSRSIQFSSAGHPAHLMRRGGQVEKLETPCVPIGVRDDEVFPLSRPIAMQKGDILVLASDGVFETRRPDGTFFGVDRALEVVRETAKLPAAECVAAMRQAACAFADSKQLDDDVTIVIAKGISRRSDSTNEMKTWDLPNIQALTSDKR